MLTIHDSTGFISPDDARDLQSEAQSWPFDVHLLVENALRDQLEDDAHAAVTNPKVMVIAIAPKHHHTEVRFGTATGVKVGDYDAIVRAGGAHFRAGEVRQGIEAIVLRAKASAESSVALTQANETVVVQNGMGGGEKMFLVVLVAAVLGFAFYLWRRWRTASRGFEQALVNNQLETAELRSHNADLADYEKQLSQSPGIRQSARRPVIPSVGPAPYRSPSYGYTPAVPAAAPVIVNNNSSGNDGFVEGLLVGDMMNRDRERVVEREIVRESPRSSDGGGAGSSWNSGGSSSDDDDTPAPSVDSGGSGSSWDSGGGSDGGGGGSDGGGGGSDW